MQLRNQDVYRWGWDATDLLFYRKASLDVIASGMGENLYSQPLVYGEELGISDWTSSVNWNVARHTKQSELIWGLEDLWVLSPAWQWQNQCQVQFHRRSPFAGNWGAYPSSQLIYAQGAKRFSAGLRMGSQSLLPIDLEPYVSTGASSAFAQADFNADWKMEHFEWGFGLWQRFTWRKPWLWTRKPVFPITVSAGENQVKDSLVDVKNQVLDGDYQGDLDQVMSIFGIARPGANVFWSVAEPSIQYRMVGRELGSGADARLAYHFFGQKGNWNLHYLWARAFAPGVKAALPSESIPWSLSWNHTFELSQTQELSFSWNYHTGLPFTPFYIYSDSAIPGSTPDQLLVLGNKNSARYQPSQRLDLRWSKRSHLFGLAAESYVEFWNLLNWPNSFLRDSKTQKVLSYDLNLPIPFVFWGVQMHF